MKISETWLREIADVAVQPQELAEQMTMAGLEVESVESCDTGFTSVMSAKVLNSRKLEGKDKLSVCDLDDGSGTTKQVICGAENVTVDHLYPYAGPGAVLADGSVIEKRKIAGIESDGMLCSAQELGLGETSTGLYELDAKANPGTDIREYLSLDDRIIDVSLTPNRGDCLSALGLAREISVLNGTRINITEMDQVKTEINDQVKITLQSPDACPRYCGRVIRDIDATVVTPVWIRERLRRSGIRDINIIVDLANYVMLETGQPMHAFDLDRLSGDISVRMATQQEKIRLLDGEDHVLQKNTLVISDASGAIAMAGIMGGESTAVSHGSHAVFIESAYFAPEAIMGRARQYGVQTDASHRFERGVDPQLAGTALERLSSLMIEYCGGRAGPVVHAVEQAHLPKSEPVTLRKQRIRQILGEDITAETVSDILNRLGFDAISDEMGWNVAIPSFRFDITQEADLVEEVARIYGYGVIKETLPRVTVNLTKNDDRQARHRSVVNLMTALGYTEVVNYSFVDPLLQAMISPPGHELPLLNPISADMAVMRKNLLSGLLRTLQFNVKRQQDRLRIFETGRSYTTENGKIREDHLLSGLIYGNIYKKQWGIDDISGDFYSLKGDVEVILGQFLDTAEVGYENAEIRALHPHQGARIHVDKQQLGYLGMVNPEIQQQLDLTHPIHVFELDLTGISAKKAKKYEKISKFPAIRRDISVLIDEQIPAIDVINCIKDVDSGLLYNLELFDVYQGEGIDLGKKSLALGLTFSRTSSTLTDEEADVVVDNVLISLQKQFGAILRE